MVVSWCRDLSLTAYPQNSELLQKNRKQLILCTAAYKNTIHIQGWEKSRKPSVLTYSTPRECAPRYQKKKKTETVWALRYKRQRPYLEHNKNRPSYFKHWSSLDEPPPTCYLSGILVLRKYQNLKKTVYVVPDILMDFPGKDQFWKPALQCVW